MFERGATIRYGAKFYSGGERRSCRDATSILRHRTVDANLKF